MVEGFEHSSQSLNVDFLKATGCQIMPGNYSQGVLESLLQVLAFFIAWIGCWLPLAAVCANAVGWQPPKPLSAEQKLSLLASLYLIAPLIVWGAGSVTGASFSDYGLIWTPVIFGFIGVGFGLGVLSMVVLFGCQTVLGWIAWQPINRQRLVSVLLPTLLLAFWISGVEELVFRGFVLTQLQTGNSIWAAAASSLIFALLHLVWEQEETIPQLPGLWLLGMVLVLARYVAGGSLGLAWGLHASWVWAIALLDSAQTIDYTNSKSHWITGKAGKPLSGAVGVFCLLLIGSILWFSPLVIFP